MWREWAHTWEEEAAGTAAGAQAGHTLTSPRPHTAKPLIPVVMDTRCFQKGPEPLAGGSPTGIMPQVSKCI